MSQIADENKVAEPKITTIENGGELAKKSDKAPNHPLDPALKKSIFREYFESLVVTLIMAFFGMTFIVQAVTVPTGSMQNTINIGDHFLVNKFIYAQNPLPFLPMREIRRGDIVVFKYPGNQFDPKADYRRNPPVIPYQTNYIKRVIGLPGDTVEFRDNQVYINGELLPEHRVIGDEPRPNAALNVREFEPRKGNETYTVYYDAETVEQAKRGMKIAENRGFNYGVAGKPSVVPADHYFMMGDARDNSEDSRVWGFVHRDLIIGRAMFVYWSCDQSSDDPREETGFLHCLTHPRLTRIGTLIK